MDSSDAALVSIVMPVFNSAEYLREAIDSVLFQTHVNFELIIIYDESTDGSLELINDYCSRDSRINLFIGTKQGISAALNIGIEKSEGKFIARMDSDDVCDRARLEKQVRHLENNDLDVCGGHSLLIDQAGTISGISISPIDHKACTLCLGFYVPFFHPTVMVRAAFIKNHNLRYGQSSFKAAEDFDLWVRMHNAGALFGGVDSIVLKYRVLDNSLSRNNLAMLQDSKELANNFFKQHYLDCLSNLKYISEFGNATEKSLAVRFIWRSIFIKGNFLAMKSLKFIEKKIFIHTTLSEILRTMRYRGRSKF